jgi:hypothetical protein
VDNVQGRVPAAARNGRCPIEVRHRMSDGYLVHRDLSCSASRPRDWPRLKCCTRLRLTRKQRRATHVARIDIGTLQEWQHHRPSCRQCWQYLEKERRLRGFGDLLISGSYHITKRRSGRCHVRPRVLRMPIGFLSYLSKVSRQERYRSCVSYNPLAMSEIQTKSR